MSTSGRDSRVDDAVLQLGSASLPAEVVGGVTVAKAGNGGINRLCVRA